MVLSALPPWRLAGSDCGCGSGDLLHFHGDERQDRPVLITTVPSVLTVVFNHTQGRMCAHAKPLGTEAGSPHPRRRQSRRGSTAITLCGSRSRACGHLGRERGSTAVAAKSHRHVDRCGEGAGGEFAGRRSEAVVNKSQALTTLPLTNHSPTHVSGVVVSALFLLTTKLYSRVLQELPPLSPLTAPRICH
jgi:hypothetical protein